MPITPFTATPDESMTQDEFDAAASTMVSEFAGFIAEANALEANVVAKSAAADADAASAAASESAAAASAASAVTAPGTSATSTTSLTIGTGTQTLTIQTGKSIVVGMTVKIAATSAPTNWMAGDVTSYNSGTGSLSVEVTNTQGSGTASAWTVSLSAPVATLSSMGAASSGANSDITSLDGLTTALSVGQGGTGATTASGARSSLSAAKSGNNSDITSLTGLTTPLSASQGGTGLNTVFRNYLSGFIMSNGATSNGIQVAGGQAADSTNSSYITRSAAITKTTSLWVVGDGNGGLDAGTIANSTWYYFYAISNGSVTDVIFSTSSTSPSLPSGYTKYRYIGAGLTDGSAHWKKFTQVGREFFWATPVVDFNAGGPTSAALLTCSIPSGRKMKVLCNANGGISGQVLYMSDPSNDDLAPDYALSPLGTVTGTAATPGVFSISGVWTNTSAQVRIRSSLGNTMVVATLGWIDYADSNA